MEATHPSINVELKINDTEIVTELDTGACLAIMSEETQKQKLPDLQIQPSAVTLKTYRLRRAIEGAWANTSKGYLQNTRGGSTLNNSRK